MAQIAKIIDVTRSYLPGDPNSFPENLHFTKKEDSPEESLPIVAYEGYNFLPTAYGYKSYFGLNSTLDLSALLPNCDTILLFQQSNYQNMLIALCSDGIYKAVNNPTDWTKEVPLTDQFTIDGTYLEYTWVLIENTLYIYRQGHSHVITVDKTGTFDSFAPSFLNMEGQMGIFRAKGRLAFWDSENSVGWSSALDYGDFIPSVETMAGNAKFIEVIGRIIHIRHHGEGFVIYATKSIVGVSYNSDSTILFKAVAITQAGGITHSRAVTHGQNDQEHYAFSNLGILRIGHFNALSRQYDAQPVLTDLFDYLKEDRNPVYLDCMQGRYLHFSLLSDTYLNGLVSFRSVVIDPFNVRLPGWDGSTITLPAIMSGNAFDTAQIHSLSIGDFETNSRKPIFYVPRWSVSMRELDTRYASAITYNLDDDPDATPTYLSPSFLAANDPTVDPTTIIDLLGFNAADRVIADVRAHGRARPDADKLLNVETLKFIQSLEWDNAITHQHLDAQQVAALTRQEVVVTSGHAGTPPADNTEPAVITVVGTFPTGAGNKKLVITDNEFIYRKFFQEVYQIEQTAIVQNSYTVSGGGSIPHRVVVTLSTESEFLEGSGAHAQFYGVGTSTVNLQTAHNAAIDNLFAKLVAAVEIVMVSSSAGVQQFKQKLQNFTIVTDFGYKHIKADLYEKGLFAPGYSLLYSQMQVSKSLNVGVGNNYVIRKDYVTALDSTGVGRCAVDNGGSLTLAFGKYLVTNNVGTVILDHNTLFDNYDMGLDYFTVDNAVANTSDPDPLNWTWTGRLRVFNNSGDVIYNQNIVLASVEEVVPSTASTYSHTKTTTYTYDTPKTNVNAGYSEFRAQRTHWDKFRKEIDGSYTLLESIPVGAFTPEEFDNVYPDFDNEDWPITYLDDTSAQESQNFYGMSSRGISFPVGNYAPKPAPTTVYPYILEGSFYLPPSDPEYVTFPGASFTLQTGTPQPAYPTKKGAWVFDLLLKKWGKMVADHKALINLSPINNADEVITPTNFGVDSGILDSEGIVQLFGVKNANSKISYGKIGYYRLGFTNAHEVTVNFRRPCTGFITLEGSIDGERLDATTMVGLSYEMATSITLPVDSSARWYVVTVEGEFDLKSIEFRGSIAGRR